MRVFYDYQCFTQTVGGVSKCFANLISNLPKEIDADVGIIFSNNIYLKDLGIKTFGYNSNNKICNIFAKIINQIYCILKIISNKYDLIHITFDQTYLLFFYPQKKYVITIHDCIPEMYYGKKGFNFITKSWINRRRKLINSANIIICISNSTKNELIQNYPQIDHNKIKVIYHGYNNNQNICNLNYSLPTKYILFVGTRKLYKNFIVFIKQSAQLLYHYPDIHIICTGPSFTQDELSMFELHKISDRIHHYFVSDRELYYLYAHALFFVFPSSYEGFGIPILEAWGNNCPIILNDIPCFREIADNAAIYCNINIKDSLLNKMIDLLNDNSMREKLIINGQNRVKKFTWKASAENMYDVYYEGISIRDNAHS